MAKVKSAKPQLVHETYGAAEAGEITRTWANSHGTYIAGRAALDEADAAAIAAERKWGCGRLRLLVPVEMREKFDRQRFLLNQALWHGDLEAVRRESGRMVKAWAALDRTATAAGAGPLDRRVMEFTQADGSVVAIVPDNATASLVVAEGRRVDVYTLDEIGRLLAGYPGLAAVKAAFPGAEVVRVNAQVDDPLEAIGDTQDPLDDPLPW